MDIGLIIQVSREKQLFHKILSFLQHILVLAFQSVLLVVCYLVSVSCVTLLLVGPFIVNFKAQLKIYSLS